MDHLLVANKNNFDEIMADVFTTPLVRNIKSKYPARRLDIKLARGSCFCGGHLWRTGGRGRGILLESYDKRQGATWYHWGECFEGQLEWLMQKVIRLKDLLRLAPIATTTEQVRKSNTRTTTNIIPPTLAPNPGIKRNCTWYARTASSTPRASE
ncbi:hypothetical protein H4Q26_012650 [Puccinia striiformis f. sp. tritici PST-130]|nr:hypothetical protein H4Q26_012650 [Puccinia striiformis f. sp. tritici PST-130]